MGNVIFFLPDLSAPPPVALPFFARFNANRNFRSEKLNGYELGFRRLLGRNIYLDIAGFYNQYYDLFSEELTGAPFIENDPAPTHVLLPAQFRNGLVGSLPAERSRRNGGQQVSGGFADRIRFCKW